MGESDVPLDPDEDGVELCDGCGVVLEEDDPGVLLTLVRDSSAVHAVDPEFDGKRMLQVCSHACADRVRAQYAARRWRRREQWAGKTLRALEARGGTADIRDVAADTGLAPWKIRIASVYSVWRQLRRVWLCEWQKLKTERFPGRLQA